MLGGGSLTRGYSYGEVCLMHMLVWMLVNELPGGGND